jgi:ABC-type uncharacterized transport system ATPase subunit
MSGKSLLEVHDLVVSFGGFVAIDHVNLTVQQGCHRLNRVRLKPLNA